MAPVKRFPLEAILESVETGYYHASSRLKEGKVPLVSCKFEDYGIEGFFEIPKERTYQGCVSIACDGSFPSTSFYHPYPFAAKDNVMVGKPREGINLNTLLYAVASLNRERWRFSYGRKCYLNKKDKLTIPFPVNDQGAIDQSAIDRLMKGMNFQAYLPKIKPDFEVPQFAAKVKPTPLVKLFDIRSGDYHNASALNEGPTPLISCGNDDNGTVGLYDIPKEIIFRNALTVAYNGQPLTSKFHPYKFATKDDVAVLMPKRPLRPSTLLFVQAMLNRERWRYSFGRKCFREKLELQSIGLPVLPNGEPDEDTIQGIVSATPYWNHFESLISGAGEGEPSRSSLEPFFRE